MAVAISGGGHRAANYGIGALAGLELIAYGRGQALAEVDYLSTVSGGGFAAAFVIAKAAARRNIAGTSRDTTSLTLSFFHACRSTANSAPPSQCLRPVLRRNFESALWKRVSNPRILFGRLTSGDALEKALDDDILGANGNDGRSLVLRDVFVDVKRPDRPLLPYWVANATIFENGAIFPFAPNVVQAYGVRRYNHRMKMGETIGPDQAEFLPLSVGLKASASFPVLIPSTVLTVDAPASDSGATRRAYLRLLDGGMGDNLGVISALELLRQDKKVTRRVLLVIDAYPGTGDPFTSRDRSERPLSVLRHLGDIALESWHGKQEAIVKALAASDGIDVIYLGFDKLVTLLAERRLTGTSTSSDARCAKLREWREVAEDQEDPAELQKAARAVGTRLQIDARQQAALLNAGRLVVRLHCDSILRAMTGSR